MINIGGNENDESYRYKMANLKVKPEGRGNGTKTVFVNLVEIARSLNIDPIYPLKYFGIELCAHSSHNKKTDRFLINGHYNAITLQNTLNGFIEKFILCDRCGLPETVLKVDKKREKAVKKCAACGVKTLVDPLHRLTPFIIKKPPSYKKTLKGKNPKKDQKKIEKQLIKPDEEISSDSKSDSDWDSLLNHYKPSTESDIKNTAENDKNTPETSSKKKTKKKDVNSSLLRDMLEEKASINELMGEIVRMELTSPGGKEVGLSFVSQTVVNAIWGGIGPASKEIVQSVESNSEFLAALMQRDKRNARNFLEAFDEFLTRKRPELIQFVPILLERLYDCDVLSEDDILDWDSSEKVSREMKNASGVFVDWLKNAEEEN